MLTRPQNARPRTRPQEYAQGQAKARAFKAKARTVNSKAY